MADSPYLESGYAPVTEEIVARDLEVEGAATRTRGFLTIFAGVER